VVQGGGGKRNRDYRFVLEGKRQTDVEIEKDVYREFMGCLDTKQHNNKRAALSKISYEVLLC
jgi:hypothetical protein